MRRIKPTWQTTPEIRNCGRVISVLGTLIQQYGIGHPWTHGYLVHSSRYHLKGLGRSLAILWSSNNWMHFRSSTKSLVGSWVHYPTLQVSGVLRWFAVIRRSGDVYLGSYVGWLTTWRMLHCIELLQTDYNGGFYSCIKCLKVFIRAEGELNTWHFLAKTCIVNIFNLGCYQLDYGSDSVNKWNIFQLYINR